MNYTYMVKCADGTLYTGWTNCVEKRLKAHNEGKAGAKYTRAKRPVELVYYEGYATKEEAMRREYAIKQLTRKTETDGVLDRDFCGLIKNTLPQTGRVDIKQYITIKWQALPSIINT